MKKIFYQKGDTIVEVLIAIAVLSLVLGGAYASSRRSLNATIQSQERSTALKIAEEQQEKIKYITTSSGPITYSNEDAFCISDSNTVIAATTPDTIDANAAADFSKYNTVAPNCIKSNGVNYYIAVGRSLANVFTVYVRWDNARGSGQDSVVIAYKP